MKTQNEWRVVWVRVAIIILFALAVSLLTLAFTGHLPHRMM